MVAGHGGKSGRYDTWREEAEVLAFVLTTLGVSVRLKISSAINATLRATDHHVTGLVRQRAEARARRFDPATQCAGERTAR